MTHPSPVIIASMFGVLALAACTDNGTPTEPVTGRDQPPAAELAVVANSWTAKATMPTGRVGLTAAVVNNSLHQPILYAIGGDDGGDQTLSTVEAYNFATNGWSTKAPMPVRLEGTNGAGVIAGKIYVSGGRDLDNNSPGSDDGFPRKSLYVYDPVSNSWSRKADMPLPGAGGTSGVINGQLYVLLGWFNGFYRYDPATDVWSALARCPVDHTSGAAAVINGKFYVAGGVKYTGTGFGSYAIRKLHVYDPVTNTWSAKALLPRGIYGAAGARLLGQFYVVGGTVSNGTSRRLVQAYDPVANTWTLKAQLPTWRTGLGASNFVLNGQQRIVAIGGYGGVGLRWLRSNDVYTP
jgi:N-acetylneuraminic acid mutarotase